MIRALVLALALACGTAGAVDVPQEEHMAAYRQRLALYVSMGQTPLQVVASMTSYFPWFGAHFGVEFPRGADVPVYFVAIGDGLGTQFYAVINPEDYFCRP